MDNKFQSYWIIAIVHVHVHKVANAYTLYWQNNVKILAFIFLHEANMFIAGAFLKLSLIYFSD